MTEAQEAHLREKGYFLYQGYHFKPFRQLTEKEILWDVADRLRRDVELGMMETNYDGKQKHPYSHEEFYEASTDKTADTYLCLENQKEYIPGEHELQEYVMEPEKQRDKGRTR